MITYFFRAKYQSKIGEIDTIKPGVWVHAENLDSVEISKLVTLLSMDAGAIADAMDPYEVPRGHTVEAWTYVYLRFPRAYTKDRVAGATHSICVAIGPENVVTFSLEPSKGFWSKVQESDVWTTQKTKLFCVILQEINRVYHHEIAEVNKSLRKYTTEDQETDEDDTIQMVNYERSLNDFLDALIPMSAVMGNIVTGRSSISVYQKDKDIVEDIQLTLDQLITWSRSTLRTIQSSRDAYSTILTNRLNQNIHHLTILTIVFAVPTMIAGLYGMNVKLPGQEFSGMFWLISIVSALVSVGVYIKYKRKK
jgi:magnesium transporter